MPLHPFAAAWCGLPWAGKHVRADAPYCSRGVVARWGVPRASSWVRGAAVPLCGACWRSGIAAERSGAVGVRVGWSGTSHSGPCGAAPVRDGLQAVKTLASFAGVRLGPLPMGLIGSRLLRSIDADVPSYGQCALCGACFVADGVSPEAGSCMSACGESWFMSCISLACVLELAPPRQVAWLHLLQQPLEWCAAGVLPVCLFRSLTLWPKQQPFLLAPATCVTSMELACEQFGRRLVFDEGWGPGASRFAPERMCTGRHRASLRRALAAGGGLDSGCSRAFGRANISPQPWLCFCVLGTHVLGTPYAQLALLLLPRTALSLPCNSGGARAYEMRLVAVCCLTVRTVSVRTGPYA